MNPPAPLARRQAWGIRGRVAVAATVVVALTLIAAAIVLAFLVNQSLIGGLDDTQLARAESIGAQAAAQPQRTIPSTPRQISLAQIIDARGNVISATANIQGEDPILENPPGKRRDTTVTLSDSPIDKGGRFRVLAHPVTLKTGLGWVYVATSISSIEAATNNIVTLSLIGLPIVLILVGVTVWRAVAFALRPVERVRRRTAEIEAADLSQRLPVPRTRDEIARLTVTMNEMLARLETASARQKQFIGDAAHELRSPLAGLRAQADVALAHPDTADLAAVLATVRNEVDRMSILTEDLLYLAETTEHSPITLAGPVDLDELVAAEAERLREQHDREVSVHIDAARIRGSQRDLTRMLRNLADNAIEHAATRVELILSTSRDHAELLIRDDGDGIPTEKRETIFQRFTRLDPSRHRSRTAGGFGLGLAIARQIADTHGGTLTVHDRSDGGSGAEFLVRLPLDES